LTISLKFSRPILYIFFILLATVFNYFTVEGKNYLLIGFSLIGALALVILNYRSFPVLKNTFTIVILAYLIFSFLINFKESEPLSLVYSFFFISIFIFYSSFLQARLSRTNYANLLIGVLLLYFFGLLAGQWYVNAGMFNAIMGVEGLAYGSFGTILEKSGFRFFSLSSEPSYAAFMVIVTYYSILTTDKERPTMITKLNFVFLILLLYMIFIFKSAFGVILLAVLVMDMVGFSWKAIAIYSFLGLSVISLVFFGLDFLEERNIDSLNRVISIIKTVKLRNFEDTLFYADFSAYFRIAPILYYFDTSSLFDVQFYLGHGAAASKKFTVPSIYSAYIDGEYRGGFMPSFLYDYGIIGGALVAIFIYTLFPRLISTPTIIIILLLFNANFNTQLFWYVLMCFSLNKHYISSELNFPRAINVNV